jgi:hypothetical protein
MQVEWNTYTIGKSRKHLSKMGKITLKRGAIKRSEKAVIMSY